MKKRLALRMISMLLSLVMLGATLPVFAAEKIEITLDDVTATNFTTLPGQAKVLVSLSGEVEDIYRYQLAIKFSGDLEYKSIQYLAGENKPSEGTLQMNVNPSDANRKGTVDAVVMSRDTAIDFSGKKLFIITFEGEPGETVEVDFDSESENYFVSGSLLSENETEATYKGEALTLTASNKEVETSDAKIRITMDEFIESGFNVNDDPMIEVRIYDSETVFDTIIYPGKNEFHTDTNEFVLTETVLKDAVYTVEIRGPGFTTVVKENITFDSSYEVAITNSEFRPGDINGDGEINSRDRDIIDELMSKGAYADTADFNRDGKVNDDDFSFLKNIESTPEGGDDGEKTENKVPAKVAGISATAGTRKASLSWNKPADNGSPITGYVIDYGKNTSLGTKITLSDASATSYEVSNISPVTYYFAIAAVNANGTGEFSEIISCTPNSGELGGGGGGGGGGGSAPTTPVIEGTTFSNAKSVYENSENSVSVSEEGQSVYHKIVPEFTGEYRFYTKGDSDTCGYLYDGNEELITYNDDGDDKNFYIIGKLTAGKVYYVVTKLYSSSQTGDFTLCVETDCIMGTETTLVSSTNGDSIFVTVPNGIPENAVIILACYEGEKLAVAKTALNKNEPLYFVVDEDYDRAMVIAWDSLEKMLPLCKPEFVELDE